MSGVATMQISYCLKKNCYDASGKRTNDVPLSKKNSRWWIGTYSNTDGKSCRMRYARTVSRHGYVPSTSAVKSTQGLGCPTYSY